MNNSTRIVLRMIVCALAVACWPAAEAQKPARPRPRGVEMLQINSDNTPSYLPVAHFGFEKPGVTIEVFLHEPLVDPIEACQRLRLTDGKQVILLTNIRQLRGHVQIPNEQMALRFVRLRTSPGAYYLWRDGSAEQEVLDVRDLPDAISPTLGDRGFSVHLPGKGDLTYWAYDPATGYFHQYRFKGPYRSVLVKTEKHPDLSSYCEGSLGILSHNAFRAGGFTPPQVQKVPGGYQITRWTVAGASVRQIRELVGGDGAYSRTVLKQRKAPYLWGIHWEPRIFE